MNEPQTISLAKNELFTTSVEQGKVQVVVLDGINNTAYCIDVPEHGHTIIETFKGSFDRVRFDFSHKIKK
ncbi:XtrA/YqaO family protein [Bacillus pumilus]|uniref:XtrA/YqaO family protein n=1 Tax=Bacillus pumilus TaxID=1408 RepID=UPI00227DD7D3|nr:XtrA/YqaO family protein [Bacillus pumilus]MCY9671743.1 XtrA/YqaO family protein [Bacillus pumilus]